MAKKIALISTFGYPLYNTSVEEGGIGGTEVQLYNLASELRHKFITSVIVSDYGQPKIVKHNGIIFYRAMNLKRIPVNYIKAPFLFLVALYRSGADIFITSPAGLELYLTCLYCFFTKKKFIHRVAHEVETDNTKKDNFLLSLIHKWSLKRAELVIVQTEVQGVQLWKNYHILSQVIPNGFPIFRKSDVLKNSILWVGRSVPWKRPELFMKLAESFPNEHFIMIASGKGSYHEALRRQAEKIENLTFLDHVSFFEIQDYYNKAKIFICTSLKEGFPNSFLHACIGGVPIISFRVNPDNFLEKSGAGLLTGDDFRQNKINLRNLLENVSTWNQMSSNARDYVIKNNDIQITALAWINILNRL